MAGWLKTAEIRTERLTLYSTTALYTLLEKWMAAGLVIEDEAGRFRLASSFQHVLVAHLLRRETELGGVLDLVRRQDDQVPAGLARRRKKSG